MEKIKNQVGGIVILFIIICFLTTGCASYIGSGKSIISTYESASVAFEDHAFIFIGPQTMGNPIQVIGIDDHVSKKYAAGTNNIIILPPGDHSLNLNIFNGEREIPRYPGSRLTFSVEAGKYYYVYGTGSKSGSILNFYIMDTENPSDYEGGAIGAINIIEIMNRTRDTIDKEKAGYINSKK